MNDDPREVLAVAIGEHEPPCTTQPSELLQRGRRKRRNRRIAYTASGTGFTFAAITAVALALPGIVPGASADTDPPANAGSPPATTTSPSEVEDISKELREAISTAYPDVEFDKPVELAPFDEESGYPYLEATAVLGEEQRPELFTVRMYPPGDWNTDPGQQPPAEAGNVPTELVNCWSGDLDNGSALETNCASEDRDTAGLVRTATATATNQGEPMSVSKTAVVYRTDDTAVSVTIRCGTEDPSGGGSCHKADLVTGEGTDAMVDLATTAPEVPQKL